LGPEFLVAGAIFATFLILAAAGGLVWSGYKFAAPLVQLEQGRADRAETRVTQLEELVEREREATKARWSGAKSDVERENGLQAALHASRGLPGGGDLSLFDRLLRDSYADDGGSSSPDQPGEAPIA